MADVLILFAAAVLVMAGGVVLALTVRAGRRKQAQIRGDQPRRLRDRLRAADDYIDRINDALSEEDLDSLERQQKGEA